MSIHSSETAPAPVNASELLVGHKVDAKGLHVDLGETLAIDNDDLNRAIGETALVIAGIRAGKEDEFLVLDTRHSEKFNSPLLLVSGNDPQQLKGIWSRKQLQVGRKHHAERFNYSGYTSANHFSLDYSADNDSLLLRDSNSHNGTYFTGYEVGESDGNRSDARGLKASYTHYMGEEMQQDKSYGEKDAEAPYGYYKNHPIIGRESRSMRNGAYGTNGSEQIIIDDKSRAVQAVIDREIERIESIGVSPTTGERAILKDIMSEVAHVLEYDLRKTEAICEPHYDNKGMVMMSEFIDNGVGVCRQQAVLAALIMESAIEKNLLYGEISVERNQDLELRGGHAWAVLKGGSGDIIVDPAQKFVGSREEATRQKRWRYNVSV